MENIVDKLKSYRYSAIERLIGLKSKSISGANAISLNDASGNNAIAFGIKGNSTQATRSGINLTNYQDWTNLSTVGSIEKSNDNIVFTTGNGSYGVKDIERKLKPNTTYTAYADYDFAGTFTTWGMRLNKNGTWGNVTNNNIIVFTTDDTGIVTLAFYVGSPYTTDGDVLTLSDIRLYEGTYTKDTIPKYEPYGASPSPEFPSEIENTSESVEIKNVGKNFLNPSEIIVGSNCNVNNGVVTQINADTSTRILPKIQFLNYDNQFSDITIIPIENIGIISFKFTMKSHYKEIHFGLNGSTKDTIVKTNISHLTVGETYTISFEFTNITQGSISWCNNMIALGNDESYEPHKESIVTFPLSEGQKLYKDTYLADDGIHHKRTQVVLDGTQTITKVASELAPYGYYFTVSIDKLAKYINANSVIGTIISSHFKVVANSISYLDNGCITISSSKNKFCFFISEDITTVSEANEWLKNNLATVEYDLNEEEIVPYTEEQQVAYNKLKTLAMFKGVNNIEISSNIEPSETSIEYYSDEVVSLDNYKFEVKEI